MGTYEQVKITPKNKVFSKRDPTMIFTTRSGTIDKGREFEQLVAAHLILTLTLDDNIKNFRLSSNDENFGDFDDVILEIDSSNTKEYYALQLKYGNNGKDLGLKRDKNKNMDLKKYGQEYLNLKNKHTTFKFLLYTNRNFEVNGQRYVCETLVDDQKRKYDILPILSSQDDLFQKTNQNGRCFEFGIFNGNSDVLKNLSLYTNQLDVDEITQDICKQLQEKFFCQQNVAREYIANVQHWCVQSGEKMKLTKFFVQEILALCLLQPYIKPFPFGKGFCNEESELLKEAIRSFQITVVSNEDVNKIWSDEDKKFLSSFEHLNVMAEVFNINIPLKNDDCTKLLWLLDKCPLMVFDSNVTRKTISLCKNKNFILVSKDSQLLFDTPSFKYLSDLKPVQLQIYRDILENYFCSIQGKKILIKSLIEQIDKVSQIISTNELVEMVVGCFEIGTKEELPKPYIIRNISRNVIDYRYLRNIKENTMVLISGIKEISMLQEHIISYEIISVDNVTETQVFAESQYNKTIVYVSEDHFSKKEFDSLCVKNSGKTCHHFRSLYNELEWLETKGKIDNLKVFYKMDSYVEEAALVGSDKYNAINIICADSGLGKTTLLRSIKNSCTSTLWSLIIYAKDHSRHFRKNKEGNPKEFKTYLVETFRKNYKPFELDLLNILIENDCVSYLWDGVDEVSDKNLITIKKIISNTSSNHWITARNNLKENLENEFGVLSRTIKEYDLEEQKFYIQSRLQCSQDQSNAILTKV